MTRSTPRGNRRGKFLSWVTARKVVQLLALLGFILLFFGARTWGWGGGLVNLAMRLDPLAMTAGAIAARILEAGALLALIVVAITLLFGRAWCGWLCPLGTVLDIFPLNRWRGQRAAPPEKWRKVKYFLLFAILIAAIFGNLTLMIFDPLTILYRTLTVSILPGLDAVISAITKALYPAPLIGEVVANVDMWLRQNLLPTRPVNYEGALLFFGIFAGIIALNLLAERFWCRYLCPLGGLLGLLSKVALFKRVVKEDCKGCGLCNRECPTGTIDPQQNFASDPAECTVCLECIDSCPTRMAAFQPVLKPAPWQPYDPSRRQALASLGLAVAATALFKVEPLARRKPAFLLRPPGAVEGDLLAACIRCGECMRACPTAVLQPALSQAGLEGLMTPVLVTRLGYCDFSCNRCGQVCPTSAIPALTLEEKRSQIIGKAYINEHRCIAWADNIDCLVCEEMCPLPEKAIQLNPTEVTLPDGFVTTVRRPVVLRDRCIGCGICEYKCPLAGESAIRVYVPGTEANF